MLQVRKLLAVVACRQQRWPSRPGATGTAVAGAGSLHDRPGGFHVRYVWAAHGCHKCVCHWHALVECT
jgi:hypothetical protein